MRTTSETNRLAAHFLGQSLSRRCLFLHDTLRRGAGLLLLLLVVSTRCWDCDGLGGDPRCDLGDADAEDERSLFLLLLSFLRLRLDLDGFHSSSRTSTPSSTYQSTSSRLVDFRRTTAGAGGAACGCDECCEMRM